MCANPPPPLVRSVNARYNFMHAPTMALPGVMFTLREVRATPKAPTVDEIYEFIKTLFNKAQLSSECSLVCLIYVERLMETAHVPLLAGTWKPVLLCGLLLASKVCIYLSDCWFVCVSVCLSVCFSLCLCVFACFCACECSHAYRLLTHHVYPCTQN